ncbi:MAG: DNA alkylation repair enzyme [Bacteroidetes bacterium ADurb.Bin012]|nr:MAG: DNA alkylation repair enzyme [Bacteroidetes bacterium ADurb.Bin012]
MIPTQDIHSYVSALSSIFEEEGNRETASGAKAYMRNQFEFYGLPSPLRRRLQKGFLLQNGYLSIEQWPELIFQCWNSAYREMQYFAMEYSQHFIPHCTEEHIVLLEWMMTNKAWWDTVDFISPKLCGKFFIHFPDIIENTTSKWIDSQNLWLQRAALIFQLNYKEKTHLDLLFRSIQCLSDSDDFFIQKAIGWALRQVSKTFPEEVMHFVAHQPLKPLSKKEALRFVNR